MTTETLLPANATALELALEQALMPGADVVAAAAAVGTAKEEVPDGWPLFLVWEYGLEELLPYIADPRTILTDGLVWQRLKGTPRSIVIAHDWLGLTSTVEEEEPRGRHWYEFQIDPGTIPDAEQLRNLVGLARLSAPVGTRLSRVYHGLDLRRAVYDQTSWSDGTLYSDHSGIWDEDLQTVISFGQTQTSHVELGTVANAVAQTLAAASRCTYDDRANWDCFNWGDGAPIRNVPAVESLVVTIIGQGVGRNLQGLQLDGTWQLDGLTVLNQATAEEPQVAAVVTTNTRTLNDYGWGDQGWGNRLWSESANT